MLREAEEMDEAQRKGAECAPEETRAERVARVMDAVRSGTYKVRSDVVANRLIASMLRQPRKR